MLRLDVRAESVRRRSILSALLLAGCGLSPRDYCDEVASATCERLFACTSGAARDELIAVYTDVNVCTEAMSFRSTCSTQTERSLCRDRRWNGAKAAACVEEIQRLACDQLRTYRPTCASPCE